MHSTNYTNAFIAVAEDCKETAGKQPPDRGPKKTVANLEYDLIFNNPYKFTSDDVKFAVHAERQRIPKSAQKLAREDYFSKGQPCFRASPLTKTYGWGVHSDKNGKIALYGVGSKEYKKFISDKGVQVYKAMRSTKK